MAGIIFGCIILVLVGWAIVKGKYAPFILIASGVAMLAFSVFFDTGTFMPKKALPTGNDYLNISSSFDTCSRLVSPVWVSSL